MKSNPKIRYTEKTHEGAPAARTTNAQALRRSVMSCLLWEREFYEDGKEIGARILELAQNVDTSDLAAMAIEARTVQHLRHVPLLLTAALAKRQGPIVGETIAAVIQRADELTEFLAVYAKVNGIDLTQRPNKLASKISNQVRKGLALAFRNFDEYQLAKYDREGAVRLKNVLFLCHAKPRDAEQAALWKRLIGDELQVPDTWETALSGGADKKATWERLLGEGKLGYLALLRNLRNMHEAGVSHALVMGHIAQRKGADRVLPFRYVAAARHAPWAEPALDDAMAASIARLEKLPGKTVILVDVSGSMDVKLSAKSDMTRLDAAAALAVIVPAAEKEVFTFSERIVQVPARQGMGGIDAIRQSQPHQGTRLGEALMMLTHMAPDMTRLIVITDEQSHDRVVYPAAVERGYMINVASAKNGVGYGCWVHIDGWSEGVIRYIQALEAEQKDRLTGER
jgi:60 kDa SS-A/Ro ribonucleoprotein